MTEGGSGETRADQDGLRTVVNSVIQYLFHQTHSVIDGCQSQMIAVGQPLHGS